MEITTVPAGTPTQTCRTCQHGDNRLWNHGLKTIAKARSEGTLAELECRTEVPVEIRKVRQDGTLVSMGDPSPAVKARDMEDHGDGTGPVLVNTCGYSVAPKCRNCSRLRTTAIRIPHPIYEGSTTPVILIASCAIPDEGIEVGGRVVTCDPKPINRLTNIIPSCENCRFRFTTDGQWLDSAGGVIDVDLTPYEMEAVKAWADPERVGIAIAMARTYKNQRMEGRTIPYPAEVAHSAEGTFIRFRAEDRYQPAARYWRIETDGEDVISYASPDGSISGEIPLGRVQIDVGRGGRAVVYIKAPWHIPFGLSDKLTVSTLRWGPVPPRVHQPSSSPLDYFAAKNPRWNPNTDLIDLRPAPATAPYVEPLRDMYVHDGRVITAAACWKAFLSTVTGKGFIYDVEPFPAMLRARRESLLARADKMGCGESVRAQFSRVESLLTRMTHMTTPSWNAPVALEPLKDYCSANLADPRLGIDFRALFGDTFGLDRSTYSGTWAYQQERDQWLRITAPGNAVQAEVMTTDKADPAWPSFTGSGKSTDAFADTSGWHRRRFDLLGGELELATDDGTPMPPGPDFDAVDVAEFLRWLDEPITTYDDEGKAHTTTARMLRYGYTMTRGSGSEAAPSIIFSEDSTESPGDRVVCGGCEATFGIDVLEATLECPNCGDLLSVVELGGGDGEARRRVGIGTAVAADTAAFQARSRLRSTVCESWVFRPNPRITYDRVLGRDTGAEKVLAHEDLRLKDLEHYAVMGIDPTFVGGGTTGGYTPVKITKRSPEARRKMPYHSKYKSL